MTMSERPDGNDAAAVEAAERALAADLERGDAALVASHYTEDGVLLLPGRAPLTGRAAIEAHFRTVFAGWELAMEDSRTAEVLVEGDFASLRGSVVQRARRKTWPRVGAALRLRHLLVLRRVAGGEWKVVWDTVQAAEDAGGGPLSFLARLLGK